MTLTMVECPYHHKRWRGGLQYLVNEFRSTFSLLHKYVRRLPAVVCACKGRSRSVPSEGLKVLFELQQWLEREGGDGPLARVRPTLERFLAAGSNESLSRETREALIGVVTLVRDLSRGNYHLLHPSLQQTEEVKEKLEEFPLHLSSDCLGLFMGHGGKHIKPLCKEYNVKVHLGGETGQSGRCITGPIVRVTVSYQGDYVEGFKGALQKRAQEVLEKKQKHEKNVEHYWKHKIERDRVKWQRRLDSGSRGSGRAYHSPKEAAQRQFEKKQQHSKPKESDGKPSFAALFGGHCLHCMAPYTSGQLQEGACNYHSGFLVAIKPGKQKGFKWTCCNKRTIAQHPTHELHTKTGCCTGRHVWRTGKPTRGKAALVKDTDSSDFYVQ